jgi:glutathione S-transferase
MVRAMDLTLYIDGFWTSPYAFSTYVALKELGVPFKVELVRLHKKEHQQAEYLSSSLTGRVPTLRHGDFWLSESSAMDEYLAEVFPPPKHARLFPEGAKERARARQLMAWVRSDLMPIREERPTTTIFYAPAKAPLGPKAEEAAQRLVRVATALIPEGKTTLFDSWCIADSDFALMLNRLHASGYALPRKVQAYVEAQWARPSVQEWVKQPREPHQPY